MSKKKHSFFSGKKETKNAQGDPLSAAQKILLRSSKNVLIKSKNILQSSHVLFSGNYFPKNTTHAEKEALKEALIQLSHRKKETQEVRKSLGAKSPEVISHIREQKQSIHNQFKDALSMIDGMLEKIYTPLLEEEKQTLAELKYIQEQYNQKRNILLEKKGSLSAQKRDIREQRKIKHKAAVNARKKALLEIEYGKQKEVNRQTLLLADKTIDSMKTDINRVKGSLMTIFPSENDQEKIHVILNGELKAQDTSIKTEEENKKKEPKTLPKVSPENTVMKKQNKSPEVLAQESVVSIPLPREGIPQKILEHKNISPQAS